MKPKIFLPLLFSLYIVNCTLYITPATVRYVSPTGSSTPPYTTWETAADSIMECINISVFGDTIYVANGTYKEQVVMIPGLSLIGAGMDSCVIDASDFIFEWNDIAVFVKDSCLLKGFTVQSTETYVAGVGIGIAGTGGRNCLVTMNKVMISSIGIELSQPLSGFTDLTVYKNICVDVGLGIYIFNSNPIVSNNYINVNPEYGGIGIYSGGFTSNYYPLIDSNYIITDGDGIRKSFGSSPTISNNVIILNDETDDNGISLSYSDSAKVFNNFIISISGVDNGGISNLEVQNLRVYNNYVIGNYRYNAFQIGYQNIAKNNVITNSDVGVEFFGNHNVTFQYNNSWNNVVNYIGFTPDSTNIEVDPMVVNDDSTKDDLDFHLQMFSPLIDAGDPTILDKDSTRSDIGLYGGPYGESYSYFDLAPRTPVNLNATLDSLTVGITWNKNTEADFNHYNVYRDTTKDFQIDSTNLFLSTPVANLIDILPDYVEKIYYKVTAVDNQDNESEASEEVGFILTSITDRQQTISDYRLYQNYPNPFNPSTKISYRLKERGYVKLYVYDIKGELVSVLVNQTQEAGFYEVDFFAEVGSGQSAVGNQLSSGIYIYQIMVKSENNIPVFIDMKKMLMLK